MGLRSSREIIGERYVVCAGRRRAKGAAARRLALLDGKPKWQAQLLRATQEGGAKRLWGAVMNDAVAALRGRHPESRAPASDGGQIASGEALWYEALAWVLSEEDEPLGTFESVCAALDVDAGEARRDLRALALREAPKLGARALGFAVAAVAERVERAMAAA